LPVVQPALRRRLTPDWLFASLVGGGLFALHQVMYFTSLKLTTVADVTLIGALQPPLVLLVAGRMFGEVVPYFGARARARAWLQRGRNVRD
jgi:drug/metabolite transporter (DMT)-like permease